MLFLQQIINFEESSNISKLLESTNLYWTTSCMVSIATVVLNIYLFNKKQKSN